VGENLARTEDVSSAQAGWLRSAIHREVILSPEWTKIGFGAQANNEGIYFAAEFSADELTEALLEELTQKVTKSFQTASTASLQEDTSLASIAQDWSELMAEQNFFSTKNGTQDLKENIKNNSAGSAFNVFVAEDYSSEHLLNSVLADIKKSLGSSLNSFTKIGAGVGADKYGKIKLTIILVK
jgi:uncharacterized protein YkwD